MDTKILNEAQRPSKTFKKWLTRVQDIKTPWSENDIIYFRKYIGSSGGATTTQRDMLLDAFTGDYSITADQTTKGINYLMKVAYRLNGEVRQTKDMPFGERELAIIKDFKEFRFIGVHNASQNAYRFYLPIYEVVSNSNGSFEYTCNMGLIQVIG